MRIFVMLATVVITWNALSQVELLCKINQNMNSAMNEIRTQIYATENRIFYINDSWDNNQVRLINPQSKQLELLPNAPRMNNANRAFSTDEAFYYTTTLLSSQSRKVGLVKVEDNINIEILIELEADQTPNNHALNGFVIQVENKCYFHLKGNESNSIYEFNLDNQQITSLIHHEWESSFTLVDVKDDLVFYTLSHNNLQEFYFFDGTTSQLISVGQSGNNSSVAVIGNGDEHIFVASKYVDSNFSFFKINKTSLSITFLFEWMGSLSNMIEHNGKIFATHGVSFPYWEVNYSVDTVFLTPSLRIKSEFLDNPIEAENTGQTRPTLVFPKFNLFAASTQNLGRELYYPDANDSLQLLTDFNAGGFSCFPFLWCETSWPTYKPIQFSFNNIEYAVLTNGNDPFLYVYEVHSNGFISKFKIHDFKRRIRFIPMQNHLYYFVYDEVHPEVRLYRIRWEDMNDQQPLENNFSNENWSTQITYLRESAYCAFSSLNMRALDVDINQQNEVLVSTLNQSLGWLYQNEKRETKNRTIIKTDVNHSVFKFDKFGKIQWENSIGELSKFFQNNDRAFFDKEGNVQVFGIFWKKGYFDGDSLETPGSARYYAKLDGQTGQVLHKKVLFETNYIDDTEFLGYALGEDNSIYLAGKYLHFSENFGDTALVSNTNFQNVLAKYDYDGNLIWVRNIHNNWVEIVGETRSINFDEVNNEINVYFTQNYNWNCQKLPWLGEVITYNTSGSEIRRKQINGLYKHTGGALIDLDENIAFVAGMFQGEFNGGVYEAYTPKNGNCFEPAGYLMCLDKSQNRFTEAKYALNNAVNFEHSLKDNSYFYLIGRNARTGKLTIVRFDHQGGYQGEKELNHKPSSYRIDFREGYFVLSMVLANSDDFLGTHPSQYGYDASGFSSGNTVLSVARFKVEQWEYASTYQPMSVKFVDENLGIWAYPNPGFDKIQFNFQDDDKQYKTYKIYDISGRFISSGAVPDQNFMIVDIKDLNPGLYHVVFIGDEAKNTLKIMKQH